MRTFWLYTAARLGILAVTFGVLYVVGARGVLLLVLAFLISFLISYWALAGMRDQLAGGVQSRAERINARMDAAAAAEDADDEDEGAYGDPDATDARSTEAPSVDAPAGGADGAAEAPAASAAEAEPSRNTVDD